MRLTITGRHMEVSDALRTHVESGLQKVRTHFDRVIDANVILSVEKHRHTAEFNLHANGLRINSKESSPDMYASVDRALERLDKQVRRYKERIARHKPRAAKEQRDYGHQLIEMVEDEEAKPQEKAAPAAGHRVILREELSMKPMSVDEAVMQLELVDDPFLVFTNADTQRVNVLYARDDSTYGLIEPRF